MTHRSTCVVEPVRCDLQTVLYAVDTVSVYNIRQVIHQVTAAVMFTHYNGTALRPPASAYNTSITLFSSTSIESGVIRVLIERGSITLLLVADMGESFFDILYPTGTIIRRGVTVFADMQQMTQER